MLGRGRRIYLRLWLLLLLLLRCRRESGRLRCEWVRIRGGTGRDLRRCWDRLIRSPRDCRIYCSRHSLFFRRLRVFRRGDIFTGSCRNGSICRIRHGLFFRWLRVFRCSGSCSCSRGRGRSCVFRLLRHGNVVKTSPADSARKPSCVPRTSSYAVPDIPDPTRDERVLFAFAIIRACFEGRTL